MKNKYKENLITLKQNLENKVLEKDKIIDNKNLKVIKNKFFELKDRNRLEEIFKKTYNEKYDGIIFDNCYFSEVNVDIKKIYISLFFYCNIKNFKMKFYEVEDIEYI
ncbi:hypothetical protein UT300005_27450 [Clostridium sp. CTA-5]